MAIRIITNTTTGVDADANNDLWILRSVNYVANAADAFDFVTFTGVELVVEGSIYSDTDAIDSDAGSANNRVMVSATGTVYGTSDGVEMSGDNHRVTNLGSITGDADRGIQMIGNDAKVVNHGFVFGQSDGISLEGDGNELSNHGTVEGVFEGVNISGTTNFVINYGTITGERHGVEFNTIAAEVNTLINHGDIFTTGPTADAVRGDFGDETVINSGFLGGSVLLLGGVDVYDGRFGTVSGAVDGGAGTDTLTGGDAVDTLLGGSENDLLAGGGGNDSLDGGTENDTVNGNDGNDHMIGGNGFDQMHGGSGHDHIEGNSKHDTIKGGTGDDTILGGNDDDELYGQKGDDELIGDAGFDTLNGGAGNDLLDGGGRNDKLDGGGGNDTLTGGGGGDQFIFGRVAGDDIITDMTDGLDLIDLTAYGLQNFNRLNLLNAILVEDGGVKIDLTALRGEGSIWLDGFDSANLDAADFII